MQKFISLLVGAAIIYMIYQNIYNINPPKIPIPQGTAENQSQEAQESVGGFLEKTISNVLINVLNTEEGKKVFENIIKPVNAPLLGVEEGFSFNSVSLIDSMFEIKTLEEGEQGPASCGHIVKVDYSMTTTNNIPLKQDTITFALGTEQIAPGVDAVITGMKTNQVRYAIINSKYLNIPQNENKETSFKVKILLREIMPSNFAGDDVKIFDDTIKYSMPLVCGNLAIFDAKITRLSNGEIVYDSTKLNKKVAIKIGQQNYPVIFSHALHGKVPVGTRTVIAKGRLFKSFLSNSSMVLPKMQLPSDEYFMLELFNFDDSIATKYTNLPQGTKTD